MVRWDEVVDRYVASRNVTGQMTIDGAEGKATLTGYQFWRFALSVEVVGCDPRFFLLGLGLLSFFLLLRPLVEVWRCNLFLFCECQFIHGIQ